MSISSSNLNLNKVDLNTLLPKNPEIKFKNSISDIYKKYLRPIHSFASIAASLGYLYGHLSDASYRTFVMGNLLSFMLLDGPFFKRESDPCKKALNTINQEEFDRKFVGRIKEFCDNRSNTAKRATAAAVLALGLGFIGASLTALVTESIACPELIIPQLATTVDKFRIEALERKLAAAEDAGILKKLEEGVGPRNGYENILAQAALIRLKKENPQRYEQIVKKLAALGAPSGEPEIITLEQIEELESTFKKDGVKEDSERFQLLADVKRARMEKSVSPK